MRIRSALFDLDGVLADSRAAIARSMNHALVKVGLAPEAEARLHPLIGPPLHDAFATVLRDRNADLALVDACVGHYRERYRTACVEETLPMDGMREAVRELAERLPLAVATSKPAAFAEPILEALELASYFRAIVGPSLGARSEPKTVTVGRALEALGAEGPTAMVGDREHDAIAARAHGLVAVGVTWGIGSVEELRRAGVDHLVEEPAALVELLG
jgi:phosphoglycolate phosphatase